MTPSKIDTRSLRKLSSLSTLPQITLEKLAAHLRVRAVKQKTQIFDQGDAGRTVYLLISGIEGSLGSTRRIRRVLITPLSKGDFFGVGSLFPDARHPLSVRGGHRLHYRTDQA